MAIRGSMPPIELFLRIVILVLLILVVLTSYAIGCWTAFYRGFDLKGLLLLVAIACFVLFVSCQWSQITWLGYKLRIICRASAITEDCRNLLEQWPVRNSFVTSFGIVSLGEGNPKVSLLDPLSQEYVFSDQFGPLIYREGRRIIVHCKTYSFWSLEYCEDGDGPIDFDVDYGRFDVRHKLIRVERISSHLYLVIYNESRSN